MEAMNREEGIKKLGDLIKGIKYAMLTTQGITGELYSRPMFTQDNDFDGTLWFFTHDPSPKSADVAAHQYVNVSYNSGHRYVSVSGTAQIVHDRVREKFLWKPLYRTWFPEGLDDPHLALIRVDVQTAEYWDTPTSPVIQILGLAKWGLTGQPPTHGENGTLNLGAFH
jgi:general stress protein 26